MLANEYDSIVFHFDGNNNDPDDIASLPMAAALAAAAGIQDKTTFFYNNNLSEPSFSSMVTAMRQTAAFAESLGIQTYDYQAELDLATSQLVSLLDSGQQVLILEGGPMEATYRALEQVSPENLSNIALLSHSPWNEGRDVGSRPGGGTPRTWSDLQSDFPEVQFLDVQFQNGFDGPGPNGFYSDLWNWLDSTPNPVLREARDLMELSETIERGRPGKRNDPSDSGMLFYALTDNPAADPLDAREYFEQNPPSFPAGGALTIEAEDATSLTGYSVFLSTQLPSGQAVSTNNQGTAVYTFNGEEGAYTLSLGTIDENDGDALLEVFVNGASLNTIVLDQPTDSGFVSADNQIERTVASDVALSPGDTIVVEGTRVDGEFARFDFIRFTPEAAEEDPLPPTETVYTIEAEDLGIVSRSDYRVENLGVASGGQVLSFRGAGQNEEGAATVDVDAITGFTPGLYDVTIVTFDEDDGAASFSLELNGVEIGTSVVLDEQLGSSGADALTRVERTLGTGIQLTQGDLLTINGFEDNNEHARLDVIKLSAVESNQFPVILTAAQQTVAENQTLVVDIEATDGDGESEGNGLTYSLSGGDDVSRFVIDPTTGVLSFTTAPDYETPEDSDGDNVYTVEVAVTDATDLTDTLLKSVTVTDVDEGTPPPSGAVLTIEAEDLGIVNRSDYRVENIGVASGGQVLSFRGPGQNENGSATVDVDAITGFTPGLYNVTIVAFDEDDGVASFSLELNGTEIGASIVLDEQLGSSGADALTRVERTLGSRIELAQGDLLTINGFENSNEHARLDVIELTSVSV